MSRLVFVNRFFHPDVSATSQMLSDLAFRLAGAGHHVDVVCSRLLYDDSIRELPVRERIDGVDVHRVASTRHGRAMLAGRALDYLTFHCATAWRLWCILRPGDIVVAKTDPPLIGVTAAFIASARGAHLVNWLQDVFPEVATRLGAGWLPAFLTRTLTAVRDVSLQRAARNVAIGVRMRRYLEGRGIPGDRITVIENWADSGYVRPMAASESRLRRELGLQHAFVVGYSGNLGRAHDVLTLLEAARRLHDVPDLVFLVVGGGTGYGELQRAVAAAGLEAQFRFLPYQPRAQLADSLAAADVHLASLREDLEGLIVPSKVYGVFAAGRPIVFIGAPDGEVGQKLSDAACGLTARSGKPDRLAQAIRRLHDDDELAVAMGERASALHRERHTVEIAVARWQQLLAELSAAPAAAKIAVKPVEVSGG